MILYLDTSALVKLFAEETASDAVRSAVSTARASTTHGIAYVEARAAFARKAAEWQSPDQLADWKNALEEQWPRFRVVSVSDPLLKRAGDLAEHYQLRAFDSVHLAAAEQVFATLGRDTTIFAFAVFDERLRHAATRLPLPVLEA